MPPEAAAVGDLYQVVMRGKLENQDVFNVWDFQCVGATDDVDLRLIVVFINCFITNLLPVLTQGYSLTEVRWKRTSPTLGVEHTHPAPPGSEGGDLSEAEPCFVSALISMRTLLGGRSHRGRKYIAGVPEPQTLGSMINTAGDSSQLWAGLLAFCACVIGAFVHGDPAGGSNIFNLGVYSRKIAGNSHFPYTPAAFTAVTSMTPVRELATTRSRKIGKGS